LELLNYAIAHNIIIIGYPPHTTHFLQGLDVSGFANLKDLFYQQLDMYEKATGKEAKRQDFIDLLIPCIDGALSEDNIAAAWRATGLRPVNPKAINSNFILPPSQSSLPHGFPVPPPSPIANVVATLRGQQESMMKPPPVLNLLPAELPSEQSSLFPTAGDLDDPIKLLTTQLSSLDIGQESSNLSLPSNIPSKPGTFAASILNSVQGTSADFLLSPKNLQSSHHLSPIPSFSVPLELYAKVKFMTAPPNAEEWKVIQSAFVSLYEAYEQQVAKGVLQEAHIRAATLRLAEKEKPKKQSNFRRVVGLEKNNILTSDQVLEAAKKDQETRDAKEANKGSKKRGGNLSKEKAAWRKKATARKKAENERIQKKYEADVALAKQLGKRKPKKPPQAPREATPERYKKRVDHEDVESVVDAEDAEEEEGEAQESEDSSIIGGDDDSYID
jgi:hypothetical protein